MLSIIDSGALHASTVAGNSTRPTSILPWSVFGLKCALFEVCHVQQSTCCDCLPLLLPRFLQGSLCLLQASGPSQPAQASGL